MAFWLPEYFFICKYFINCWRLEFCRLSFFCFSRQPFTGSFVLYIKYQALFNKERTYNEHDIIEGCKGNIPDAQKALYYTYGPKLKNVCLRFCHNRPEADDMFQEAFMKILNKIDSYSGSGSFEGWMRRIVLNTMIDFYKQGTFDTNYLQFESMHDKATEEEEDFNEEDFENLGMNDLMDLINQLPDGYKMVFNLYAIEDYSHKDIAAALGISEGTSKSQLAKARKMLRTLLEKRKTTSLYELKTI